MYTRYEYILRSICILYIPGVRYSISVFFGRPVSTVARLSTALITGCEIEALDAVAALAPSRRRQNVPSLSCISRSWFWRMTATAAAAKDKATLLLRITFYLVVYIRLFGVMSSPGSGVDGVTKAVGAASKYLPSMCSPVYVTMYALIEVGWSAFSVSRFFFLLWCIDARFGTR